MKLKGGRHFAGFRTISIFRKFEPTLERENMFTPRYFQKSNVDVD